MSEEVEFCIKMKSAINNGRINEGNRLLDELKKIQNENPEKYRLIIDAWKNKKDE